MGPLVCHEHGTGLVDLRVSYWTAERAPDLCAVGARCWCAVACAAARRRRVGGHCGCFEVVGSTHPFARAACRKSVFGRKRERASLTMRPLCSAAVLFATYQICAA